MVDYYDLDVTTYRVPNAGIQELYVTASAAMLKSLSHVGRFAWFALPHTMLSHLPIYTRRTKLDGKRRGLATLIEVFAVLLGVCKP